MKSALLIVVVLLFTAVLVSAENKNPYSYKKASVENLKLGLESDNLGLRKSCIYMIGQYKVKELVKPLLDLLDKEEDASVRILIAFSLYYLGAEEGMTKIKLQSYIDNEPKVRIIYSAIYDEFSAINDPELVQLTGNE